MVARLYAVCKFGEVGVCQFADIFYLDTRTHKIRKRTGKPGPLFTYIIDTIVLDTTGKEFSKW